MKRVGTVLTFAPGVTMVQAREALNKFVADNPGLLSKEHTSNDAPDFTEMFKMTKEERLQYYAEYRVNEYDDQYGSPVWYIP